MTQTTTGTNTRKLYNVVIEIVDLVWADSESDAIRNLRDTAQVAGFEPLAVEDRAEISEPVPGMGWDGETATCQHVWRFSDSRNAFICATCYEIDEAL